MTWEKLGTVWPCQDCHHLSGEHYDDISGMCTGLDTYFNNYRDDDGYLRQKELKKRCGCRAFNATEAFQEILL